MGLSRSKHPAPPSPPYSSSSRASVRRSRSSGWRVLKSDCLRSRGPDNDDPQVSESPSEENGKAVICEGGENKSGSCHVSTEYYSADKSEDCNKEWGESSFTNGVSEQDNTSSGAGSPNRPSRFLSRLSFHPRNLSFRLSRPYPASSTGLTISNGDGCVGPSTSKSRGCEIFPACFTNNRSPGTPVGNRASGSSPDLSHNFLDNRNDTRENCDMILSSVNNINSDGVGIRRVERRREPVERNVRFSRTLSMGRLRDRVLRRNPAADIDLYDSQQEGLGHEEFEATSDDNSNLSQQVSSDNNAPAVSINLNNDTQNNGFGTPRGRETRYRDLLEHRSNFLERRRRIRSQVRALQRLGSRFENLSSHERSCIFSGQHLGGHCTCRVSPPNAGPNDDANARASISRIVMLAEALFEVLDEIHQQSVVVSSRSSASCIGSIPAPREVVDSLPVKIFSKLERKPCDDTAQCYICLVEYDDGDSMRILPCKHEFHRACVDKWLKEIHRVCPLCRGDICRPGSLITAS